MQAAKTYFTDVQLKTDKPQEFLAETDVPQVQINRETMARFRPEMRKFYYDARNTTPISTSSASSSRR